MGASHKLTLRPRLVQAPARPGGCWALVSLTDPRLPRVPCERWARLGSRTCSVHHDWEAAAQTTAESEAP